MDTLIPLREQRDNDLVRLLLKHKYYLVELVHLYSNREAWLETLRQLLIKATSARRPHGQPVSRQTQIRLNPHQATALAAAYRDGLTMKELAQRFGVHRTTVSALLRRHTVPAHRRGKG